MSTFYRAFQNRRIRRAFILAALALVCAAVAMAQRADPPSQILNAYRNQRIVWFTNVWPAANTLFGLLALIDFAWSAAVMVLEKQDFQSWVSALIRKIMTIGAFYALLIYGRVWIPAIVDSFEILGQNASGSGPLDPGEVFMRGLNVAGALIDGASSAGILTNFGASLALVFAAVMSLLGFLAVTIQFVVALVESYILVAGAFVFLGFGGSRWSAPYVERYIALAVSIGVKIMLLYLLIGTGMNVSVQWLDDAEKIATAAKPATEAFSIMGASLIFTMLCWQAPKLIAGILGGSPYLTGGDLMSTGGTVAAGAMVIGAAGYAAASGGGSALSSIASGAGSTSGMGTLSGWSASGGGPGPSSAASDVPPPRGPAGGGAGAGSTPTQPEPPSHPAGGLADLGGEPLAGSGFEREKPNSAFSGEGRIPSSRRASAAQLKRQVRRFRVPSDGAPVASPPRFRIEHDND